jgi:transposase
MQARLARGTRYYFCGRRSDNGPTTCSNSLRRPVDEADRVVVGWLSRHAFDEDVVLEILKEVRRRLKEQGKKTNAELPRLQDERAKLAKEIDRLAEAVATAPNVKPLVVKLQDRQER